MTGLEDVGSAVNAWVNVVRRARLTPTVKLVALVVASYADPDGTKVFPGLARLVVQCDIGYSTARKALRVLRDAGLIEMTRRGNRRLHQSDEYRLILAADLLDRLDVLSPEQEREAIAKFSEQHVAAGRTRQAKALALSQKDANHGGEPVDNPPDRVPDDRGLALPQGSANRVIRATWEQLLGLPPVPTPSIGPLPVNQPPYLVNGVRTDLKVVEPSTTPKFLAEEEDQPRLASVCSNALCRDGWIKLGINVRPCPTCRPRSPGTPP